MRTQIQSQLRMITSRLIRPRLYLSEDRQGRGEVCDKERAEEADLETDPETKLV